MEHAAEGIKQFIDLTAFNISFLIILGFFGGLISGFIGSGGAFVLTPGMMNLGASAPVAVASNMCHKFPKAMVGAYKRHKYGQVDLRLGAIIGLSAVAGVQLGIRIQEMIIDRWGEAGSNLYVSVVFITILLVVGTYMLRDLSKSKGEQAKDSTPSFAKRMQRISLPPMIKLKGTDSAISLWVTIPVGFATGMLAATIAVGGFIGVPGMIYIIGLLPLTASATELVVAFIMGMTGVITWGLGGYVDLRMTLLILAGSLFGVQLGAIGTTYVRDYVIKFVMVAIMLTVAVSRCVAVPSYLNALGTVSVSDRAISLMDDASFAIMCVALGIGGFMVLGSMWLGKKRMAKLEPEIARPQPAIAAKIYNPDQAT